MPPILLTRVMHVDFAASNIPILSRFKLSDVATASLLYANVVLFGLPWAFVSYSDAVTSVVRTKEETHRRLFRDFMIIFTTGILGIIVFFLLAFSQEHADASALLVGLLLLSYPALRTYAGVKGALRLAQLRNKRETHGAVWVCKNDETSHAAVTKWAGKIPARTMVGINEGLESLLRHLLSTEKLSYCTPPTGYWERLSFLWVSQQCILSNLYKKLKYPLSELDAKDVGWYNGDATRANHKFHGGISGRRLAEGLMQATFLNSTILDNEVGASSPSDGTLRRKATRQYLETVIKSLVIGGITLELESWIWPSENVQFVDMGTWIDLHTYCMTDRDKIKVILEEMMSDICSAANLDASDVCNIWTDCTRTTYCLLEEVQYRVLGETGEAVADRVNSRMMKAIEEARLLDQETELRDPTSVSLLMCLSSYFHGTSKLTSCIRTSLSSVNAHLPFGSADASRSINDILEVTHSALNSGSLAAELLAITHGHALSLVGLEELMTISISLYTVANKLLNLDMSVSFPRFQSGLVEQLHYSLNQERTGWRILWKSHQLSKMDPFYQRILLVADVLSPALCHAWRRGNLRCEGVDLWIMALYDELIRENLKDEAEALKNNRVTLSDNICKFTLRGTRGLSLTERIWNTLTTEVFPEARQFRCFDAEGFIASKTTCILLLQAACDSLALSAMMEMSGVGPMVMKVGDCFIGTTAGLVFHVARAQLGSPEALRRAMLKALVDSDALMFSVEGGDQTDAYPQWQLISCGRAKELCCYVA